jgi:hypothetical protein
MKYVIFTLAILLSFVVAAVTLGGEVEVIDPSLIASEYPEECYEMTDAEFFQWATNVNQLSRARVAANTSDEPRWVDWWGYESSYEHTLDGLVISRKGYPKKYLNPAYKPPGALRIINPYCKPTR